MRPIDADALKVRLSGCMILMPNGEKCTAKRAIDTQGTISPEVRRGRWENGECTNCKRNLIELCGGEDYELARFAEFDAEFCPFCGARMYGGADNG